MEMENLLLRLLRKDIAFQGDGKLVVAGGGFSIARYNTDGSLDSTFKAEQIPTIVDDTDSYSYNFHEATTVSIQSDGKIILGGDDIIGSRYFEEGNGLVARYNTDGSLDKSFSGDGRLIIPFSPNSRASLLRYRMTGKYWLKVTYLKTYSIPSVNIDRCY